MTKFFKSWSGTSAVQGDKQRQESKVERAAVLWVEHLGQRRYRFCEEEDVSEKWAERDRAELCGPYLVWEIIRQPRRRARKAFAYAVVWQESEGQVSYIP